MKIIRKAKIKSKNNKLNKNKNKQKVNHKLNKTKKIKIQFAINVKQIIQNKFLENFLIASNLKKIFFKESNNYN